MKNINDSVKWLNNRNQWEYGILHSINGIIATVVREDDGVVIEMDLDDVFIVPTKLWEPDTYRASDSKNPAIALS